MAPDLPTGAARWLARGVPEIPTSEDWLTEDEAARAAAMPFTKRRTEYLLRRWVGKQTVAAVMGVPDDLRSLARIELGNRASGAPYVVVDDAEADVDLSLTDRAGWAVCVVAVGLGRVGCDLEIVEARSPGFVADYLTAEERAYVVAQAAADQDAAANLVWSAKESGLKVLQTGLRRDARSVEVAAGEPDPTTGWGRLEVGTPEGRVIPGWWRRAGTFLLTIAAEAPLTAPVMLAGSADLGTARPVHTWVSHPRSG